MTSPNDSTSAVVVNAKPTFLTDTAQKYFAKTKTSLEDLIGLSEPEYVAKLKLLHRGRPDVYPKTRPEIESLREVRIPEEPIPTELVSHPQNKGLETSEKDDVSHTLLHEH